jgi:hypothetical protein
MMDSFYGGLNGDGFFGEEYRDDWEQGEWSSGHGRRRSNQTFYNHNEPRPVKCIVCGFENLKWVETSHGWRTAYSSGLLKDKVHACGKGI